jgi:hypothetical protein
MGVVSTVVIKKRATRVAICKCGHRAREHSMTRAEWDIGPLKDGERRTGDGHCFHWERDKGFCKCNKFETE